ncbi:MAG: HEAT repeat domain-containing protein [Candidatus Helarchaeota archaeon]|nr:HEAT repeat domain-containing protein [Candidatus Helarchaeota archaeon]
MITGAPYSWIDATNGTQLMLGGDGYSAQALPFPFQFYDGNFTTVYLSTNGYLSFADSTAWHFVNQPLPSADPICAYFIGPYWDDLTRTGGGSIYVQSFPTYWVAAWHNIYQYMDSQLVGTFEVILYENGDIKFQYDYISYIAGGYTTGLNLGDGSTANSYNGLTTTTNDFAILFEYQFPPPNATSLDPILPNPDPNGVIDLNWAENSLATSYYIYRDTSNISSVAGLTPIATVDTNSYQDTITINGTYYYVVVCENIKGNSSISNCVSVDVVLEPPNIPTLDPITPNPNYDGTIFLDWTDDMKAVRYYVYRNNSEITSVIGLTPIAIVTESYYQERLFENGNKSYVIVAGNTVFNSSISNCEAVELKIFPVIDIFQNPTAPNFQDPVNIMAHIVDPTGIKKACIEINSTPNYLGFDTFTETPLGTNPVGWSVSESGDSYLNVTSGKDGHASVVESFRGTQDTIMLTTFPFQTIGAEIELWIWGDSNAIGFIELGNGGFGLSCAIHLELDFSTGVLTSYDSGLVGYAIVSTELKPNEWTHLRIRLQHGLYSRIWLNKIYMGEYQQYGVEEYIDRLRITHSTAGGPSNLYIDAIDYSWDLGYYLNRNQDYLMLSNYSLSLSNGTYEDGYWNFTVPSYPVQKDIGYRIIAIDNSDNINSSEMFLFGVFDWEFPNVLNVNQTPIIPIGGSLVNITTHISDNFEVDTVYIETNVTKSYHGESSFTNDESGSYPSGWNNFDWRTLTEMKVIPEKDGHFKVVEFRDNDDFNVVSMNKPFSDQENGTVEWWIRVAQAPFSRDHLYFTFLDGGTTGFTWISHSTPRTFGFFHSGATGNPYKNDVIMNQWYHIRLEFNCTNQTIKAWTNGIYEGEFSEFKNPVSKINGLRIETSTVYSYYNFMCWIDAIDFSWTPGYYPNRNMDFSDANYTMNLLSGTNQNGVWNYNYVTPPQNTNITYRIAAIDVGGNENYSKFYNFYVDTLIPNIEVTQDPSNLTIIEPVNITAHVVENVALKNVLIETNHTGTLTNYSMTLLSGSLQDGLWNFTFSTYPINSLIIYRIIAIDAVNNTNSTTYWNFYADTLIPNIIEVTQDPANLTIIEPVNITAHVVENVALKNVLIETNHTGTLTNYSMTLLSGSLQDGLWNFTFSTYPINSLIIYRIIAIDAVNNTNSTTYWSFYADTLIPNIIEVTQDPANLTIVEPVNITVHLVDNHAIASATIESNHTGSWTNQSMLFSSGTVEDNYWQFSFNSYPVNNSIWYRIYATDAAGNTNVSSYHSFVIFSIIAWETPSELELEINLRDRGGEISFLFSNTGNSTFLALNFSINLPTGWSAYEHTISIPSLAPGANTRINFHIIIPKTNEPFEETITIDFNATVLETGQLIGDSISIMVTGVKDWIFLWLIIIFGSVAGASTLYYVNRKYKQKKRKVGQKISTLIPEQQKLQPDVELGTINKLISKLSHKDSKVRLDAVWKLADLGDKRAVKPVLQLLQDPNSAVRAASAKALGSFGDSRALLTALTPLMSDQDSLVRKHAAEAIEKLHQTIQRTELIEITFKCKACGHEWAQLTTRALSLFYCPKCKMVGQLHDQFAHIKKSEEATPPSEDSVKNLAALEPSDVETQQVPKTKPEERSLEDIIINLETKLQARQGQESPITEFRCPYCKNPLTPQQVQNLQKGASVSCPGCLQSIPPEELNQERKPS